MSRGQSVLRCAPVMDFMAGTYFLCTPVKSLLLFMETGISPPVL